jgi:signal peptidase I
MSVSVKPKRNKSFWREVLETILLTVVIFFLIQTVTGHRLVKSISMQPNLYENYRLLVNKMPYFHFDLNGVLRLIPFVKVEGNNVVFPFGGAKRGDIVVIDRKNQADDLVKRVIGLGGEKLEIKTGQVFINDKLLEEPYLKDKVQTYQNYAPITIPPDQLFVMGDNRNNSSDSRAWGCVRPDEVVGKVEMRYYPFGDGWGIIFRPIYN